MRLHAARKGFTLQEQLKFDERNFYPGRLRETGIGLTYQRMIWKGLFAAIEVLPQLKTYLDDGGQKVGSGFKLYTSYHLGYHIRLFGNRVFIEPQIHCQYRAWPRMPERLGRSARALDATPGLMVGLADA